MLNEIFGYVISKAAQDSVSGANFHPEDLSQVIYLEGAPPVPFLRRLGTTQCNGSPHYWSEIALASPSGTSAYFYEGQAPTVVSTAPSRLSNTVFQAGLAAEITDKEAALYMKPGGFQLSAQGKAQWFKEEMALQMMLRTEELIRELDYIFINGDKDTTITASGGRTDVQCDGLLTVLTENVEDASNAALTDDMLIDLAEHIQNQYTGRFPQVLYTTTSQKKTINTWVTNIWFTRTSELTAGVDVSTFNTGFFVVSVEIEPYMPTGSCAMVDHSMWKKADLLPLRAEPLARTATSLKRMITYYGTLEFGNQRSSGKVYGLNH